MAGENNGVPRDLWFYSPMGRSHWSQSAHRRKTSVITVRASEQFGLGSKILACLSNLRWVNFGRAQESSTVRLFQIVLLRWDWSFWRARTHGSPSDSSPLIVEVTWTQRLTEAPPIAPESRGTREESQWTKNP
jgi:hypothetical protein